MLSHDSNHIYCLCVCDFNLFSGSPQPRAHDPTHTYLFCLLCPFLDDVELLNVVLLDGEFVLVGVNVAGTDVALTTVGLLFERAFELDDDVKFWLDEFLLGVVIFLGDEL